MMQRLFANILDNPILTRELRRRMRGRALMYSIITYITAMTLSTCLVLLVYSPSPLAQSNVELLQDMRRTGEMIFAWITTIQFILVLILAPTITAGLTTAEKERRTFDFLRVTTITRWMYILGCFLSTTFYVLIALLCALPLLSLAFLYGGVALDDVIRTFVLLFAGSCVLSSVGLYVSSISERTRTAQGIVIFLVFMALILGLFTLQQLRILFAGAGAQLADGELAASGIQILGRQAPGWLLLSAGLLVAAGLFMLLAARKLFEPEEVRPLNHSQFAVLFAAFAAAGLGILSTNPFQSELGEIFFLLVGFSLLLAAVLCFAVGRMEVGDEIWHLKRHLPILRPFDQTIPYLVLLAGVWWLLVNSLESVPQTPQLSGALRTMFLWITLAAFFFLVMAGRASTALLPSRRKAVLCTFLVAFAVLVLVPLLAAMAGFAYPAARPILWEFVLLSPFVMAIDGIVNASYYDADTMLDGHLTVMMYLAGGVIAGIYGEIRRLRRWRGFDYHYDMPSG